MHKVKNYLSLIKFAHTIFAMPFALIGFFLGLAEFTSIVPGWHTRIFPLFIDWKIIIVKLALVILCMVFARSAAMAFNRFLDHKWDAMNPRTAIREIPKGIITPKNALAFTIINCIFFVTTTFFINRICFFLAPVALAVVLGYSYTKRFTALCHIILGLGLSLAPIGAYLAVTGSFHWLPVIFSFSVLFWVSGFDIIYALQDVEFDQSQSLYSIPALVGKEKGLRISEILHFLSLATVVLAGKLAAFGWLYWLGVLVFGICLVYQHSIVKPNDLKRVNLAFMTMNGIASVVFAVFVISDLFIK
jgi:4-hydroxybenzoate polyprenyltransferase